MYIQQAATRQNIVPFDNYGSDYVEQVSEGKIIIDIEN